MTSAWEEVASWSKWSPACPPKRSEVSDTLKKAAGLFFEFDDAQAQEGLRFRRRIKKMMASSATGPTKTMEQVMPRPFRPELRALKVPPSPQPSPFRRMAPWISRPYLDGECAGCRFTAEQLLDLLATLPPELPLDARRQTVKITIQAMAKNVAVTPEIIVADASRKLKALASAVGELRQAGR